MRPVAVVTDTKGYHAYSLLWQAPDGGRVPWLKLSRDEAADRLFAEDTSDPPSPSQPPGLWTNNWKIVTGVTPSTNFARDLPARRLRAAERAKAAASGQRAGNRRNPKDYPPPAKIPPLGLVVTTNGRYFSILWKDNRVDEHTAFTSRAEAERALKSSQLQPPPGDTIPGAWTNRWTRIPDSSP